MSNSLPPHGPQHARPLCLSPSPRVCPSSCLLNWWCYPTISSSAALFSSCLLCFPASGSFPMIWFFASGGQSIGVLPSPKALVGISCGEMGILLRQWGNSLTFWGSGYCQGVQACWKGCASQWWGQGRGCLWQLSATEHMKLEQGGMSGIKKGWTGQRWLTSWVSLGLVAVMLMGCAPVGLLGSLRNQSYKGSCDLSWTLVLVLILASVARKESEIERTTCLEIK